MAKRSSKKTVNNHKNSRATTAAAGSESPTRAMNDRKVGDDCDELIIPADMQALVREAVDSGRYGNAQHVVNDALKLWSLKQEAISTAKVHIDNLIDAGMSKVNRLMGDKPKKLLDKVTHPDHHRPSGTTRKTSGRASAASKKSGSRKKSKKTGRQ